MDKKMFRSLVILITLVACLVLAVVKFDSIWSLSGKVVAALSPLTIGLVIAFILNQPYEWLRKLLLKGFLRHTRPRVAARPGKAAGAASGRLRSLLFARRAGRPDRRAASGAEKRQPGRLARPLAVLGVYIGFFLVLFLLAALIVPQFIESIRTLVMNSDDYLAALQTNVTNLIDQLPLSDVDLTQFKDTLKEMLGKIGSLSTFVLTQIIDVGVNVFQISTNVVLGLILSVYLLLGKDTLLRQSKRLLTANLSRPHFEKTLHVLDVASRTYSSYVIGQITEAFILGTLCFVGMSLFRFEYALIISTLVGITGLIPIVGAYLGVIPGIFLMLTISPMKAVWFVVFIIVLQQIEGNLIYPRVVGTSIGLPALWVLTAITLGSGLFGVAGMMIAVPTFSVFYQLIRENTRRKLTAVQETSGRTDL